MAKQQSSTNNSNANEQKSDVENTSQLNSTHESEAEFSSRLQECPIAVVGMASIFAEAKSLEDYWDNIVESVNAITDVPDEQWELKDYFDSDASAPDKTYCKRGGFLPEIDFDPMEFGLPPNILELTEITQLLSLVVAREVLIDAGIGDGSGYDRDKVGITLGVGGGQKQVGPLTSRLQGPVLDKVLKSAGVDSEDREMIIEKFKKAYIKWEENSFPGMLGNVIAGRIANRFDFGGTNCVVDAACASSLSAVKLAISDLLEYRSEVMISGGVCCDNSPFMYMSFSKTPAFTSNDDIRPFDVDSKGMMIGEGIGMMAFKRLEDAERDGDKIYAVLKGIGTSSDGRFKSIYAPRPDGQAKALSRAYKDAGFEPKSCGLIEAHGTGTKAGDAAEFSGLTKHFSQDNDAKQHIAVGSVKSQIGHTKAAAGAAGMIKAILALHHKVLPASINIDTPNPALAVETSPLYLNSETRPWMPREDGLPRRAGISSFGFGGTNFHVVLEEYQAQAQGQYRLNNVAQAIIVHAQNQEQLISVLSDWQSKLSSVTPEQAVFVFNALVAEFSMKKIEPHVARCGFIAKSGSEALTMINMALKQFNGNNSNDSNTTRKAEYWSLPTGVYYRQSALNTGGKVVALFSGQGSQYLNMGRELACNFPTMMQAAANMDKTFLTQGLPHLSHTSFPIPAFNSQDRNSQAEKLQLTQYAQPAIGSFSVGLYKTFEQAGFKADFAAGHSFGELTALWASGVLSETDYMQLAQSRGQAMAAQTGSADESFDAGTMIAVVGDIKTVANDIKDISGISIANYNSNNQVVVAGETEQIATAIEKLKASGHKVVQLPVSAAFHTPLVAHAQKPFADAIDKVTFTNPNIPVYANGTGKAHEADGERIKAALKNHILESVHFNEEVDNLYAAGARVFIEFGPKNVLSKLVDNILADKDDVTTIAINSNAKQCSDKQLRLAAVHMAVLGIPLDNIDSYDAVKRPLTAVKMSPLAMKLTGKSYVSPKTEKAFADALADGQVIKQAKPIVEYQEKIVEKVVEKVIEVERIVEVEKPVYISNSNVNAEGQSGQMAQSGQELTSQNNNDYLAQFIAQQQQMLQVHEQYMQNAKDYSATVTNVLMANGQSNVSDSTAQTLKMYHDFQSETLRVHEQYLANQNEHLSQLLSQPHQSAASITNTATQVATAQAAAPVQAQQTVKTAALSSSSPVQQSVSAPVVETQSFTTQEKASQLTDSQVVTPQVPTSSTNSTTTPAIDINEIQTVMLSVVAEKTGYPTEMLSLDMDMEADLGIDSIKRVEILGAVQETINDLPDLNPEDLAELRTLEEIVQHMQSKVPASEPTSVDAEPATTSAVSSTNTPNIDAPTIDLKHIENVMMQVVADKTGYPTEMLNLEMDMEADLGIDSIKRVEILGAVQEIIIDLPDLNPEDLAELRTLEQIVEHMQSKVASSEPAMTSDNTPNIDAPTIDLQHIENVMMQVVADKTGYPTEMLNLEMDMEADLGIDSIKRVEILGAVQEIISDLPDLNPEDLAELRTLEQIVQHMQSKVSASEPVTANAISSTNAQSIDVPTIDLQHIENVMMQVVADKTGYPTEMLNLEMDMEADLGIDSIKRVEILGAVQEIINDLPDLNPEDLAELRTLEQIVQHMQSKVSASEPATEPALIDAEPIVTSATISTSSNAPTIDLLHIETVMMQVVADKTGYPTEMLNLEMDMEADLGIDSIKRVEILGAVQEIISDLPDLNPEDLAELRTLEQIVQHMQSKVTGTSQALSNDSNASNEGISDVSSSVVSEKAPSATVAIKPLSSVNKIIQQLNADNLPNAPKAQLLLVDDGSGTGATLSKKLTESGWQVTVLQPNWLANKAKKPFAKSVELIKIGDTKNTLDESEIKAILAKLPQLDAVIYLQEKVAVTGIEYPQGAKQGLMLAFLLAKYCQVKQAQVARASFVAVTRQGGTLGLANIAQQAVKAEVKTDLVQGGLAGLVKTLSHEWPSVFCRVIDLSSKLSADKSATVISDELLDVDTSIIEVGHDTDNLTNHVANRLTLVAVETDSYELDSVNNPIDQNSVFLVSGGAKGVTAHCVIEIAKKYQSSFILLGRSPLLSNSENDSDLGDKVSSDEDLKFEPSWANGHDDEAELKKSAMQVLIASGEKPTPVKVTEFVKPILANREIVNTINAIKAAGGQVEYVASDVTDSESVQRSVNTALSQLQNSQQAAPSRDSNIKLSVTGIVHGAGVLADKYIEQKTLAEFEAVYRTKIDGLTSLLSACQQEQLQHLVLFSSAAGFYGNPGQSDYSIANDILNKTAYRFKALNPNCQVLSFNWGPWDGGMVTPELKRMFDQRGVYIIPLDAGAKLLVSELGASSNRCAQILVGNDLSKTAEALDAKNNQAGNAVKKLPVSHLSTRVIKTLQVTNNAFLNDHMIGEDKVLPTVCAIACMRDAAKSVYSQFNYQYQAINHYKLFKGITFSAEDDNISQDIVIDMQAQESDNAEQLLLETKVSSVDSTGKTIFHYAGQLQLVKTLTSAPQLTPEITSELSSAISSVIPSEKAKQAVDELYQNGTLFHGESLQGISHVIACDKQSLLLRCDVPEIAAEKQGEFSLSQDSENIFVNDLVYQAMLVWVKKELGLGSLPVSTDHWQHYATLKQGKPFYLQLTVVESSVTESSADKSTGNGGNGSTRGKLIADINIISDDLTMTAQVKGAIVTASSSLNKIFLSKSAEQLTAGMSS